MLIQALDTVSTLAGGTQPYTTTQAFRLRGVDVPAGEVVQLSTSQAARLLDMGVVQAQQACRVGFSPPPEQASETDGGLKPVLQNTLQKPAKTSKANQAKPKQ